MNYSAIHKKIILSNTDLDRSIEGLKYAMKKYRIHANIPLTKRNDKSILSDFDMAEREMLQALKNIGIDFGADWGKDLDLS